MKIIIIGINGIPAQHGGFETCVDNTSTRIATRGHKVIVYCRSRNIKLKDNYYKKVRLVKLPSIGSKHLETISHSFLSVIHLLFRECDVVHIYGVGSSIFVPLLKILKKKIVVSVDALDWERDKWGKFARWYLKKSAFFAIKYADEIIVDSKVIQKFYKERFKRDTVYIPYGASAGRKCDEKILEKHGLKKDKYLLFVGRLIPEKGVHNLIEAYKKLNTELELIVIGGDWFTTKYIEFLKDLAKGSNVRFLGFVYGEDYNSICSGAYIYIQPSEVDGTSPSLLAAMGFGNCVIANGIPENLETIGNAWLSYKINDVEDLKQKLKYLISNPERVSEYRKKAEDRIRFYYDWDRASKAIEELYKKILDGEKVHPELYEHIN